MSPVAERHDTYVAEYGRFTQGRGGAAPEWVKARREQAQRQFAAEGFPNTRQEDWRFTNVAPIAEAEFSLAAGAFAQAPALVAGVTVPGAVRLVIVNGEFAAGLSDLARTAQGAPHCEPARRRARRDRRPRDAPGAGLQPGFASVRGAQHRLPRRRCRDHGRRRRGGRDAGPHRDRDRRRAPVVAHPRVLIVAGENSQVRVAQTFIGAPDSVYFNNAVAEVVVHQGALVQLYTDQRESDQAFHVANIQAHVEAKGVFESHAFSTGGRIMRHDIGIGLKGEGADCTMNGVYLADGERLMDTHTSLDHAMPHCTSHEIYKGILAGKSKAVFNGRIIVRLDAQKTDAKQTNRALLLSDDATINSNPQLEIFADDVKCTHGAAVGQLDEEALFYLQARGLDRAAARDMLLHAFAGEVLEGLKIPALREQVEANFFTRLRRGYGGQAAVNEGYEGQQVER